MITPHQCVIKSDNFVWRKFDDEAILIRDDGSQFHMLNKVAGYIWELADGKATVDDIIAEIWDRFDVEEEVARADTLEFIHELVDKHILQLEG